ncbi:MAG: class I SAM-dependent methyltransferase [Filifactoraceae bacterium]
MNFDERALKWDDKYRVERAKLLSDILISKLPPANIDNVMEFGCGTGLFSCNLSDQFKNIYCIDTSEKMIEVLDEKLKTLNIFNVKTACRNLLEEDEASKSEYDLIFTSMALHHIVDIERILNIFYKLLNEGGKLAIIDLNKDNGEFHSNECDFEGHHGFEECEFKKLLEKIGFKNISIETIYKDIKYIEGKNVPYSLFLGMMEK